jgi:iron complex outermembrane receptor protein
MKSYQLVVLTLLLLSTAVHAQNKITGRVQDKKDGTPLLGVNIIIEELKIGTSTNPDGNFEFTDIKNGSYTLRFSYIGHKTIIKSITVPGDRNLLIELEEGTVNLSDVVVTGNPFGSDAKDISQSTLSVSNLDLLITRSSNIANTLNFQPGISIRSNGISTARPIIRGFSNNRILILENGLRMGDLSNTSDDHGVSNDGSTAERLEVLRGPASLLYGSNALGGVINIISEAIPRYIPDQLDGDFNISSASVNKDLAVSGDLHYGVNDFGFHANYFRRKSSNYLGGNGIDVENSDQFSTGYQLGFSFIPSFGLGGLSYSSFNTKYGIPVKTEEEFSGVEEHGSEDFNSHHSVDIEMNKRELRFLIESSQLNSFINSFSLKTGYQDYEHLEILKETGEIESEFGLKTFSADLSFKHSPLFQNLNGVFGIYLLNQNYTIKGEEAFTPNADYFGIAGYFVEQLLIGKFNFQFGVRVEKNIIKIPESELSGKRFDAEEKNFDSFSASIGVIYSLNDEISFFANAANAFRSPTIEELSSYAIHGATGTFDIGSRNLVNEKNIGFDFGFRLRKYHHLVELSGYYNRMVDYIYREPTGQFYNSESSIPFNNSGNGFPVYRYRQTDAELYGFELKAQYEISRQISITTIMDYTKGNQILTSTPLPQMPPFRFSVEPRYADDEFWFGFNWKLVADQNNVAQYEEPTKGYGLIDLYVGTKIQSGKSYHIVNLRAENILNQSYRDHLSSIKDFALMPGRNVKLSYKFLF